MSEWKPSDGDSKCQKCGEPNATWFADSTLWNAVVGGDPNVEAGGIFCLRCFADMYQSSPARSGALHLSVGL